MSQKRYSILFLLFSFGAHEAIGQCKVTADALEEAYYTYGLRKIALVKNMAILKSAEINCISTAKKISGLTDQMASATACGGLNISGALDDDIYKVATRCKGRFIILQNEQITLNALIKADAESMHKMWEKVNESNPVECSKEAAITNRFKKIFDDLIDAGADLSLKNAMNKANYQKLEDASKDLAAMKGRLMGSCGSVASLQNLSKPDINSSRNASGSNRNGADISGQDIFNQ